jgi:hypothetical protein
MGKNLTAKENPVGKNLSEGKRVQSTHIFQIEQIDNNLDDNPIVPPFASFSAS